MTDSMLAIRSAATLPTRFTAEDLVANAALVDDVVKKVMKKDIHYGVVPGTKKQTLLQPGADALCVAFRIAPTFKIEDLSTDDCVRYQVTCVGTHQTTGIVLAEGMGECSSDEAKYKWRTPVCKAEFDEAPENRKRRVWKKGNGEGDEWAAPQMRTDFADQRNTVLKMACKRAKVAMTINATAASHTFTQDAEDRAEGGDWDDRKLKGGKQSTAPQRTSDPAKKITAEQLGVLRTAIDKSGVPEKEVLQKFNIDQLEDLTFGELNAALLFAKV